jgi:hypothetical protein
MLIGNLDDFDLSVSHPPATTARPS